MSENTDRKAEFLNAVKKTAGKISESAEKASDNVKTAAIQAKTGIIKRQEEAKALAAQKKKEKDLKELCPVFEDDLISEEFRYERVIRIVNYDARLENEACKGSVGFYEVTKDRKIPTIYSKFVHKLGLSFYPQLSESVFIADPCIDGKYIEIDEYYNYMKQVRINELTVLAQALGAKHITISYSDSESSSVSQNTSANTSAGGNGFEGKMKGEKNSLFKKKSSVSIWADTTFKTSVWNSSPVMPTLLYFRNESDISSLIQMAMVNKSKIVHRTYRFQASASSGLALSEAASIEGALKVIKCNAGANLEKQAKTESKSVLEYTIDF